MKRLRPLIALAISAAILIVVFTRIDIEGFTRAFRDMDWGWFIAALAVFVPIYYIRTLILTILMGRGLRMSNAFMSIMAASSLNAILPSKSGELVKGVFLRQHIDVDLKTCLAAVVLERVIDVTALVILLLLGLTLIGGESAYPGATWLGALLVLGAALIYFVLHLLVRPDSFWIQFAARVPKLGDLIDASRAVVREVFNDGRLVRLGLLAILLWLVHVFQFYCFFQVLGYLGHWTTILAFVPAAIFIALLPITIAGIGTRDVALIALFSPWASPELAAGVGILSHIRYVLPGLAGIAFAHWYVKRI